MRPVDIRERHDGLAAVVRDELRKDPVTGAIFVLRAKHSEEGLRRIEEIYHIECEVRGQPAENRLAARRERSTPVADAFGD